MQRVLKCTFPFPEQTPPVQVAHPCVQCPNADRALRDLHATIAPDDPELLVALHAFARWFFAAGIKEDTLDGVIRYACDLYTREDHTGTCIPKTILFACYKSMQFDSYFAPQLSDDASAALKGLTVGSWPDGAPRSGRTWNELFAQYGMRYD